MMRFGRGVLVLLGLAMVAPAFAQESPYLTLYRRRVEVARANLERQKVNVKYDLDRLQRGERLYQSRAVSLEELNELRRRYELATSEVTVLETKAAEAAALLDTVQLLVQTGRPVPLCNE